MGRGPHGHRVLPHHPASVRLARGLVLDVLAGEVSSETVDAAESVASELMTNAVVHAGTAAEIEVRVEDSGSVYLAVTDGAPQHPVRPRAGAERSTGRGLVFVASLTREWGVAVHPDRKVVWCRIGGPHASTPRSPDGASGYRTIPPEPGFEVALVNVPLRVYTAWMEDAEALLRDYLLAGIEETAIEDSLRRHARCSEAFALLVEAFADVSADEVGSGLPEDGHAKVTLSVPPGSVEDFRTLNEVLESAGMAAASGVEYVSAATSPAAQSFRRWLCREVLVQSLGGEPTSWEAGAEY